jgi:hypothetical protein
MSSPKKRDLPVPAAKDSHPLVAKIAELVSELADQLESTPFDLLDQMEEMLYLAYMKTAKAVAHADWLERMIPSADEPDDPP